MVEERKTYLFRLTHAGNVKHIQEYGITHKNSANANPAYEAIGDSTLISARGTKEVKVEDTGEVITLGDYIPFYFAVRTPMLYVMQKGGNFVPGLVRPQEVVYCVLKLESLSAFNYYFSNGHATDSFTRFYSRNKVEELYSLLDFSAIKAKYWSNESDLDLKRRKQAECLVEGDVKPELIAGYVVYDSATKERLISQGIPQMLIVVRPEFYF